MENESTKITMPLYVMLPRKTKPDVKKIINLNYYRNWHRMTESQVKKAYAKIAIDKLKGLKFKPPIKILLTYFKPTARRSDRSNVLCIHEKYFCDAMVEAGCIEDDNDKFLFSTKYEGGEKDKNNPRVEILIMEDM